MALYSHTWPAVRLDKDAGRGACLRDSGGGNAAGAGLGFRDRGHHGTKVIGPAPTPHHFLCLGGREACCVHGGRELYDVIPETA